VAIITASASTALKRFGPAFQELLNKKDFNARCFIAGGNGTTLFEVKKAASAVAEASLAPSGRDGLAEIYNHGMNLEQVQKAVEIGKRVYEKIGIKNSDLSEKGLENFKKFLQDKWEGYVPAEIIDVCRPYNGEIFTERAKVTFVLPKDKSLHEKLAIELNAELSGEYRAAAGDDTYIHITKKLEKDGKVVAIKTILKLMSLGENQVATFGDMPMGNDAGLLSFPYSFTNAEQSPKQPPYVLSEPDLSPVARVYKAIEFLLV